MSLRVFTNRYTVRLTKELSGCTWTCLLWQAKWALDTMRSNIVPTLPVQVPNNVLKYTKTHTIIIGVERCSAQWAALWLQIIHFDARQKFTCTQSNMQVNWVSLQYIFNVGGNSQVKEVGPITICRKFVSKFSKVNVNLLEYKRAVVKPLFSARECHLSPRKRRRPAITQVARTNMGRAHWVSSPSFSMSLLLNFLFRSCRLSTITWAYPALSWH